MEIIDYPNYLIHDDGRVYNKKRNKFLKHRTHKDGYKFVGLYKDGKEKRFSVHRLVAIHYIPNPDNKPEVDHISRIKYDNRIENLRWATGSENNQNKEKYYNNTSGHKNISYHKQNDRWLYEKTINGKKVQKYFDSKIDCICYKYISQLKIRSCNFTL